MTASEKAFAAQFMGLLDNPMNFAAAVVVREFGWYRERYRIPFQELLNETLVRLWEARQLWDSDPNTHSYRYYDKQAKEWVCGERKFTTFAWHRAAWYVKAYIQSAYIGHDGIMPISYLTPDGKDEDYEEFLETSLLEDPEEISKEVEVSLLIDLIMEHIRSNGVQGETGRRITPEVLAKYRRMLELLAAGFSPAEAGVELGYSEHRGVTKVLDCLREQLADSPSFMAIYGPFVAGCNGRTSNGRGPERSYELSGQTKKRVRIERDFSKMSVPEIVEKYGVHRSTAWRARKTGFLMAPIRDESVEEFCHYASGKVMGFDSGKNQVVVELQNGAIVKTNWSSHALPFRIGQRVEVSWVSDKPEETRRHFYTQPSAVEKVRAWTRKSSYQRIHEDTTTFGHQAEAVVLEALEKHGVRVERATDFEDEKLGVDLWAFLKVGGAWRWMPLDVTVQITSSLTEDGKARGSLEKGVISTRVFPNSVVTKALDEIFDRVKAEVTTQAKLAQAKHISLLSREQARDKELKQFPVSSSCEAHAA